MGVKMWKRPQQHSNFILKFIHMFSASLVRENRGGFNSLN